MVTPFINFSGLCNCAIEFYEKIFNITDKKVLKFKDMPKSPNFIIEDKFKDYILHAEMILNGTKVWLSDTTGDITKGDMVSLSIDYNTIDEVKNVFDYLKEDGEILIELAPTFYSPMFGTVKDKFGIIWHIICNESR